VRQSEKQKVNLKKVPPAHGSLKRGPPLSRVLRGDPAEPLSWRAYLTHTHTRATEVKQFRFQEMGTHTHNTYYGNQTETEIIQSLLLFKMIRILGSRCGRTYAVEQIVVGNHLPKERVHGSEFLIEVSEKKFSSKNYLNTIREVEGVAEEGETQMRKRQK